MQLVLFNLLKEPLTGDNTPGQSEPGSNGNEGVLRILLYIDIRPGQTCHSKDGGSCIFHWRRLAWLTIWDRFNIPRYSHKLMYRKRVTCELHDSYFRSMMIKTCHSKDGGSGIFRWPFMEEIEWVLNYYITQCTGNSSCLEIGRLEIWCCRENSARQKGSSGPPIEQLGIRRVGDKMR